jgi:hypothetical protein
MKIFCFIVILLGSTSTFSQNWAKLGNGIPLPNGVTWKVEPYRNELFLIGTMYWDGDGNTLRGLAKWDGQSFIQYAWEMPLNATSTDIFRYKDDLYISTILSWDEKYWLAYFNETELKLDTVYDKTLYGPVISSFQINDTLYLSGLFRKCGADTTWGFCRFDGESWSSLYSGDRTIGNTDDFYSFTWYKGKLYVAGYFYIPDGNGGYIENIAILENGELQPFGGVVNYTINGSIGSMCIYRNELYVAGYFLDANGVPVNHIMRWDGTEFKDVVGGADNFINDMIVYKDNLYICGPFTTVGGVYAPNIARWDGNEWHGLMYDDFHADSQTVITDMQIYNDELYIAGGFTLINNDTFNCVAKYNHQLPGDDNELEIFINNPGEEIIVNYEDPGEYSLLVVVSAVNGQMVNTFTIGGLQGYTHQNIPIPGLASGVYIVTAVANGKSVNKKLLKMN